MKMSGFASIEGFFAVLAAVLVISLIVIIILLITKVASFGEPGWLASFIILIFLLIGLIIYFSYRRSQPGKISLDDLLPGVGDAGSDIDVGLLEEFADSDISSLKSSEIQRRSDRGGRWSDGVVSNGSLSNVPPSDRNNRRFIGTDESRPGAATDRDSI
jgi:hypothetical protein